MGYEEHLQNVRSTFDQFDPFMDQIDDGSIQGRYLGFMTVVAVTEFELAIKDIFISFSEKKHRVFGEFAMSYFERLNGRIKLDNLRQNVGMYGDKYVTRFVKQLEDKEKELLSRGEGSPKQSYNNIIIWRHSFVHGGSTGGLTNYGELKVSYHRAEEVIRCLDAAMKR